MAFTGDLRSHQPGHDRRIDESRTVWNLPMIFAVEDNGFGEASASGWAVAGDVLKRAAGYDIPAARVDGTDVFAVYEAAGDAIARARSGGGPSLLHILVPRYFGHFSGDADTYRPKEEKEHMRRERDCLKIFRTRVLKNGALSEKQLAAIDSEVNQRSIRPSDLHGLRRGPTQNMSPSTYTCPTRDACADRASIGADRGKRRLGSKSGRRTRSGSCVGGGRARRGNPIGACDCSRGG